MWLLALALSACDASSAPDATDLADAADPPDSGDDAQAPLADGGSAGDLTPRTVSGTFTLTLDAGAFAPTAAHPSALVYLPSGFRPTAPLSLIVYLHGFSNCVENIVRDAGQPCTPGGGVRSAYALAAQLEASGKNAMLLCPEAAFDQATGNPGNLGAAGGLRALVQETLADLQPQLAPLTVADVGTVIVASHSGGYQAAGAIAARGGLPVSEIFLLDSLYDGTLFDAWVKSDLTSLAGTAPAHRFADVYLSGGTTATNSVAMANRAATWVAPDAGILRDDRITATFTDGDYRHGLVFKASALAHDAIPRFYFGALVSTSQLPAK